MTFLCPKFNVSYQISLKTLTFEYESGKNDINLLDKILDLRDNSIIEEYEYTLNGIISQKYNQYC